MKFPKRNKRNISFASKQYKSINGRNYFKFFKKSIEKRLKFAKKKSNSILVNDECTRLLDPSDLSLPFTWRPKFIIKLAIELLKQTIKDRDPKCF